MRSKAFFVIVIALLLLVYGYLSWRLVLTLDVSTGWKFGGCIALLYPFLQIFWLPLVYWNLEDTRPTLTLNVLVWTSYGCMAWVSLLLFSALSYDLALFFVRPSWFFGVQGTLAVLGTALAALALGVYRALRGPRIRQVSIRIKDLPESLEGFRIAHLSDLHIGPIIGKRYIKRVVRKTNALKPHLVAITGDLVDGDVEHLRPVTELLAGFEGPAGRFYVTGNHEYYWEAEPWVGELRRLGFEALLNEHRVIEHEGARLVVAGVPDAWVAHHFNSAKADPRQALAGAPSSAIRLLLSHQPSIASQASAAGFHLQLSGHTHGGQFIPWSFFVRAFHRFAKGLYRLEEMWIYVNVGTGFWGPPMRLGTTSEITLLRLTGSATVAK